ncbi:MAG: hypothetical protein HZB91_04845 [Elusimicrobia bacterium]|nr:hypothetical protein [Elusimicrobiota bacterium]
MKPLTDSRSRPDHAVSESAPTALEHTQENAKAIRASMQRWQEHNRHGRSIGRGLSDSELVDRVAGETGASKTHVRLALRDA